MQEDIFVRYKLDDSFYKQNKMINKINNKRFLKIHLHFSITSLNLNQHWAVHDMHADSCHSCSQNVYCLTL